MSNSKETKNVPEYIKEIAAGLYIKLMDRGVPRFPITRDSLIEYSDAIFGKKSHKLAGTCHKLFCKLYKRGYTTEGINILELCQFCYDVYFASETATELAFGLYSGGGEILDLQHLENTRGELERIMDEKVKIELNRIMLMIEGKDRRMILSQSPFTGLYYMNSGNYLRFVQDRSAVVGFLRRIIFADLDVS